MSDPYEGWTVVELMGHRKLAGYVREQEIAGAAFLRLDIHGADSEVVTQFYSASAVYCLTPTTEEIARKVGERVRPQPVTRYEIEPPRRGRGDDEDPPWSSEPDEEAAF